MTKYALLEKYEKEDGTEVEITPELIMGLKLPLQLREITKWFLAEYGVGKEVEQGELFKALDSHQEDNKVLSRTPVQPISRIMAFYRGRLEEIGLYKMDKEARAPRATKSADGKTTAAPKKSKRKMAEEAVESGAITEEEAAPILEGQSEADQTSPVDPAAAQVM